MHPVSESQQLEEQKRGITQVATVFQRGIAHGKGVGEMYLPGSANISGLHDNLKAVVDAWAAQHLGTLSGPSYDTQAPLPLSLDYLALVRQFYQQFRHPVVSAPAIPDEDRCRLRAGLLEEELDELFDAITRNDLVGIADALVDLQYVLSGAVLEFGLASLFPTLFREVHRSNMSKACLTEQEAQATVVFFTEKGQLCTYEKTNDGQYLVFRTADHKLLKSVNYSPADLAGILNLSTPDDHAA